MRDDRTALYRHFNAAGDLLYVGISLNAVARLCQHRQAAPWFPDIARVEIEWLPTREAALDAEKAAIRSERPLHNVIYSRFGSAHSYGPGRADGFPAQLPWPIPAKFALIAWGIDRDDGKCGAVAVGYQPYRCDAPGWFDGYTYTSGASYSRWQDFNEAELRNAVLVEYFMLTNVYEIDPRVASQAFLNIKEFRDAVEAGILGPNLIGSDLPYIAKSDPRPERRFQHSVHVFPRMAAQAVVA